MSTGLRSREHRFESCRGYRGTGKSAGRARRARPFWRAAPAEQARQTLSRRPQLQRKRREKRYDPLRPQGGFRHEPKGWFERIIHHKWAFGVVSVVGGLVLLVGTIVLFNPPTSTSTNTPPKQSASTSDEATAPSSIDTTPAPSATPSPTATGT